MKKDDITNKSLATLLIVAIVVSIGGTWLVLNKAPGLLQITGAPTTDTGTATVTIETVGSVRFAVSTVNFGTGKVNTSAGNDRCILDTNGTNNSNQCINFTAVFGNLTLENDGSQNATIQLVSNKDAASFIGGTASIVQFRFNVNQNESQSCRNGTGGTGQALWDNSGNRCFAADGAGGNCTVNPQNWTDVNTTSTGTTICQRLLFTDINDSIALEINITIPNDASAGVKTATFTATATSTS